MGKPELRKEALARQGQRFTFNSAALTFIGSPQRVAFEEGGEGLVQKVVTAQGEKFCVKAFWEPTSERYDRSLVLVQQQLANRNKATGDALGGAPFALIKDLGTHTPFAVVMKNVSGTSWRNWRERARGADYPPAAWPSLETRATWGYGLATAVLRMEERQFVHADLSPGNVMLTPEGDMALVDFDGFVHPQWNHLDLMIAGSPGYAAPEIAQGLTAKVGSDRVALALLIQEFLLTGESDVSYDEVFRWAYDQKQEINLRQGEAHPAVRRKWPQIADLVEAALCAPEIAHRPAPELWRHLLFHLAKYGVEPTPAPSLACGWQVQNAYPQQLPLNVKLPSGQAQLDLAASPFRIRATLQRDSQDALALLVQDGATLRIRAPGATSWQNCAGGTRCSVVDGLMILDPQGFCSALLRRLPQP